ncbi:MAG: hypothetical protein EBZ69_00900 [Alphaproteobacteria bacterium]|nr:hypothetical protein [Alphaproteobacteria bacterium]
MPQLQNNYLTSFYLGRVQNDAHTNLLAEIAAWLDTNKFSCTFSIVEGRLLFEIEPFQPPDHRIMTPPEFKFYAAEHVINQLSRTLGRSVHVA